ncbi:MAG: bifunctional riboflavin kinase/FAD synthetase [Myxococcales bacterium]|nr:bifunctional riboflavin kinase/FAD synthetase [Myxococcales bacterium]MCB9553560.1 bifunctional riboflavin kinase/FAD synthetase [Myxococcales bacterium]
MLRFSHHEEVAGVAATAVAIGNFDGVHLGHLALLDEARRRARASGAAPAVLTFDPHPVRLLAPTKAPPLITTPADKEALLAAAGVEVLLAQRFDRTFAALSPVEFAERVLVAGLRARAVVVGYDFCFGAKRAGDTETLRALGERLGFAVAVIAPQTGGGDEVASSSRVREHVAAGEMEAAAAVLGRPFHVSGPVVHGFRRGHDLGFPTANIAPETELEPAVGIYAGWLDWGAGRRPAVVSVGHNPSFGAGAPRTVEAHVIDASGLDLYGRHCRLWLGTRLRDEQTFADLDALVAAIGRDRDAARDWLAGRPPPDRP